MRPHDNSAVRGFTLIEVMVVVALVTIISMLAIPSFTLLIKRMRLASAARGLYSGFVEAQSLARSTVRTHCLTLHNSTRTWTIDEDTDGDGACDRVMKTVRISADAGDVAFGPTEGYPAAFPHPYTAIERDSWCTACDAETGSLVFSSEGMVTNETSGSIVLHDATGEVPNVEAIVFIGETGDVRSFRWDGS